MTNRSPLHSIHEKRGARFVDFGGWDMPVQYESVLAEHRTVRQGCGWFDVSHLGRGRIGGVGTLDALLGTFSNDAGMLDTHRTQYTLCLNQEGGIVDDVILWRLDQDFLVLPNAGNSDRVLGLLGALPDVSVDDLRPTTFAVAIQGPKAPDVLQTVLGHRPRRSHVVTTTFRGAEITLGGTGYSGEAGGEVIGPAEIGPDLIDALESAGAQPCGLGARDTLRLEAGLPLWGQDIDQTTLPAEAGLEFAVSFTHQFTGREALETATPRKRLMGFATEGRLIPRPHHRLRGAGGVSGEVTSGNFSPTLGHGIGMGYLDGSADQVEVEIRGAWHPVDLVSLPFYRR